MIMTLLLMGAGVFGVWTAYKLRLEVRLCCCWMLMDQETAVRAPGASRGLFAWAMDQMRSIRARLSVPWSFGSNCLRRRGKLFQKTGVLWLARENDSYCEATLTTLQRIGANYERLDREELARRFPQLALGPITWGILEPDSGALMARRAVQVVAAQARTGGVDYVEEAIAPPQTKSGKLNSIRTTSGKEIVAERFVFACGPWLPKLFPDLLGDLIHVTRQEVFFFGVPPSDDSFNTGVMPAWIDFNDFVYSIPNVDGRGFKIAIDAHGSDFDPDSGERVVTASGLNAVREYLAQRVPRLVNAPVTETRVCQYENTSNGDFLIDRHPAFENVWLVGGGSGHGFKHGPAVGEYAAEMIMGRGTLQPRFSLVTKQRVRQRKVY